MKKEGEGKGRVSGVCEVWGLPKGVGKIQDFNGAGLPGTVRLRCDSCRFAVRGLLLKPRNGMNYTAI